MLSVSAVFQTAIAQSGVRLCEIVDVVLAGGMVHRYTSHDKDITWNAASDTYSALLPSKYRGPIRYHTDGSFDTVKILLGMIESDLRDYVLKNILEAAEITIRLIRWDAAYAADEEIVLFVGSPDIAFNARAMKARLISQIDSLNMVVPRDIYKVSCNRYLFDDHCGLVRADYAYSGTATGGSATTVNDSTAGTLYKVDFDNGDSGNPIERGDAITGQASAGTAVVVQIVYLTASTGTIWYVEQSGAQFVDDEELQNAGADSVVCSSAPAADPTFYAQGEIEMLSGDNTGECRPVLSDSGSTRTVIWPFVSANAPGDLYNIWPGCGRSATAACKLKYGNQVQWRAFPYVPLTEEVAF